MPETNSKWRYLSIAAWLLVLAVLALGWLSLTRIRDDLADARAEIAEAELVKARLDSQMHAYDSAVRETRQYLEQQAQTLSRADEYIGRLCEIGAAQGEAAMLTYCANRQNLAPDLRYADYLVLENEAAALRGRGAFAEALEAYGAAAAGLGKVADLFTGSPAELDLKRMVLAEGRAFSAYRLGQADAARQAIGDALALSRPGTRALSGFVFSTDLKIRCSAGLAPAEVRKAHAEYLAVLRGALEAEEGRDAGSPEKAFWTEYRKADLGYFESDPELRMVCGLA